MRGIRQVAGVTAFRGIPVLYMDNHLLVAVKPPNLPAQADASGDPDMLTLMKQYVKEACEKPGAVYLGLLHRLDRPVGGLMAFARTSKAAARLSEQLRTHAMQRTYHAVVRGAAEGAAELEGTIAHAGAKPRHAVLSYECVERAEGLSLVAVRLRTGRKHQIRIQLREAGLPIWGDARYGNGAPGEQIALWGTGLTLNHPTTKEAMAFESVPPDAYPWNIFKIFNS